MTAWHCCKKKKRLIFKFLWKWFFMLYLESTAIQNYNTNQGFRKLHQYRSDIVNVCNNCTIRLTCVCTDISTMYRCYPTVCAACVAPRAAACVSECANCFRRKCVQNTTDFLWNYKAQRDHTDIVFPAWLGRRTVSPDRGLWLIGEWISKSHHWLLRGTVVKQSGLIFVRVCFSLEGLSFFFTTIKVWPVLAITKWALWHQ